MCDRYRASHDWRGPVHWLFVFSFSSCATMAHEYQHGERPSFLPHYNQKVCSKIMELRHLRYFVAVAEAENVTRAALKLHVSQPALSRQIRDLEDELGFLLLQRDGKSVRLTEAGRAFLSEARAVLKRSEDAISAGRAIASGQQDELHVGYAPSLTAKSMPPTLRG